MLYTCVNKGNLLGVVSQSIRQERLHWFKNTNTHNDDICKKNCLDVCVDFNIKAQAALVAKNVHQHIIIYGE